MRSCLDQAILAEGFPIEKDPGPKPQGWIEPPVCVARLKCHGVDAERRKQAGRYSTVGPRAVDPQRPAINELDFPIEFKLVSFGVAAKIVMVVENQDADVSTRRRTIEIGRGEPADTATHYDEIVMLARMDRTRSGFREATVTQCVGCLEAARVAAAHSRQGRRIIIGTILGC
jgi:hypothetical protein